MDSPASRNWIRWALVLGIVLRLARPEVHSFWIDEGATLIVAQSRDMLAALHQDSHPPLSFLIWRGWGTVFGWSDLALRILPALVSCASLLLFVPLARAWLGRERAVWAVALYAASPLLVWLAHEVRMYAFVEFATLATLVVAQAAWSSPRVWRWLALAACVAVATGVHYYGSFAGLIVIAQALVRARRGALARRTLLATIAACALGVLVWTPWFLTVLHAQYANDWPRIAHFDWRDIAEAPARLLAVDLIVLVEHGIAWIGWILGALCALGLVLWCVHVLVTRRSDRDGGATLDSGLETTCAPGEVLCAALVPIAASLALTVIVDGGSQPRYWIPAAPGMIACIAAGLVSVRPSWLGRAACAALLGCALILCALQLSENRREDYRDACREIVDRWRSGDHLLVVCCVPKPYVLATVDHYLRDRPDILASVVDTDRYLSGAERLPSGSRLHVLWREATICWQPFDELRRTHTFVEEAEPRFRIHRLLAAVP
jgi:4-amino-4-deoxy-L-arabinose transferase-like glycosyltransferase